MAYFSDNFTTNHLKIFQPKDNVEKLIDESVRLLNNRTVDINSMLVISLDDAEQIKSHCQSLGTNTRTQHVLYNSRVSYGIVAHDSDNSVTVYRNVDFRYAWNWGQQWNSRQIVHFAGVATYLEIIKTVKKTYVEDFPALGFVPAT